MDKIKEVYNLLSNAKTNYLSENSTENYNAGFLKDLTTAEESLQEKNLEKVLSKVKIAKKFIWKEDLPDVWINLYNAQYLLVLLKKHS